jgi:hypothetical protein
MSPPGGDEGLNFRKMFGNWGYQKTLSKLYKSNDDSWLTPAELFKPWYARGLARFMTQQPEVTSGKPVSIVEAGGGNGTAARGMLDFLKAEHPDVYERTRYTIVEISGAMASRQHALLSEAHSSERFQVINNDFLTWEPDSEMSDSTGFIVALEVLDNLPHDKLVRRVHPAAGEEWTQWSDETAHEWSETWVVPGVNSEPKEVQRELGDSIAMRTARWFLSPHDERADNHKSTGGLLAGLRRMRERRVNREVLNARGKFEAAEGTQRAVFVPSGATSFLDKIAHSLPGHRLVASDFSALPVPDLPEKKVTAYNKKWDIRGTSPGLLQGCKNSPLVSRRSGDGQSQDFETYLVPAGSCDIFFQTDFGALKRAHREIVGREAEVWQPRDFLNTYAEVHNTRTLTGFNPMIDDFSNTRFFIGASALE